MALDEKMQMDINALHAAASYLDPPLKPFHLLRMAKNKGIYLSRQYKLHRRMRCILMAFLSVMTQTLVTLKT